jgi:hypothetical protein
MVANAKVESACYTKQGSKQATLPGPGVAAASVTVAGATAAAHGTDVHACHIALKSEYTSPPFAFVLSVATRSEFQVD